MALRVGLIGLKGHQGTILSGVEAMDEARLVAVADDDEGRLSGVTGWPSADEETQTFTDSAKFFEVPMDIVGICGMDAERAPMILEAAKRGIHVIAEKPLAMDLDELDAVRKAVAESGIELSMLLTMRFEPPYITMRRLIAEGAIGKVCLATMQKSYRLGTRPAWQCSRETFSGIIPFIGIHALDLIRWVSGREFTEGAAWCSNVGHPEVGDLEDNASVALQLDNGGTATARMDYCRPAAAPTHGDDRLRIAGSDGVIEWILTTEQVTLIRNDEEQRVVDLDEKIDQFADFVATVRGEKKSWAPAEDCLRMTDVVLRLREVANTAHVADLR
ncbi:MAG: Gfo/Idh/MocA family oxidoreductase [candidate division WS1 bacterium]|jgi:predicted dehydrogenase|nr:Gfo/Idh/MocA family oxidoreductase [candidate division WS1 bacterium]